jgi:hypothetical protein
MPEPVAFRMKFSDGGTQARLRALGQRYNPTAVLSVIGRRLVNTEIPRVFAAGGPGWKIPLRGGAPLRDRGILGKSFVWRVAGARTLLVGSTHPGSRLLNRGGTVVPKTAQWLTIPFAPNLSTTERITFKLRAFKNVFFLRKGPKLLAIQRQGKSTRLIAVLVKSVTIPARRFLGWDLYGRAALDAASRYLRRLED